MNSYFKADFPIIRLKREGRLVALTVALKKVPKHLVNFLASLDREQINLLNLTCSEVNDELHISCILDFSASKIDSNSFRKKLLGKEYVAKAEIHQLFEPGVAFESISSKTAWGGKNRVLIMDQKAFTEMVKKTAQCFSTAAFSMLWYLGRYFGQGVVSELTPYLRMGEAIESVKVASQCLTALGMGKFNFVKWVAPENRGVIEVLDPFELEATKDAGLGEENMLSFTKGAVTGIFEKIFEGAKVSINLVKYSVGDPSTCTFEVKISKE